MMPLRLANKMYQENDPEEISEQLDFNKPSFRFEPNEQHDWRQKGPYLVCRSCEVQHATYVGLGKMLMGLDSEGKPILKSR